MNLFPVVDIRHGIAVRGIAGNRSDYKPLQSIWTDSVDPVEVARTLWKAYKPAAIYIADLDAIEGRAANDAVILQLESEGVAVWLDAGLRGVGDMPRLAGAAGVITGLETLSEAESLSDIVAAAGCHRVIFSLDMKDAKPLGRHGSDALAIAGRAVECGIGRLILLDLARVGTGTGTGTVELARQIRERYPQVELVLGGGISSQADIDSLDGIQGVLVASALHDGRIKPRH